jgi:hypothetical protein
MTKVKSMGMCNNNIQRVKVILGNKIIEQASQFKDLGYVPSDHIRIWK